MTLEEHRKEIRKEKLFENLELFEESSKFDITEIIGEYANEPLKKILENRYQNTVLEYFKSVGYPEDLSTEEICRRINLGEKRTVSLSYYFAARVQGIPTEKTIENFAKKLNDLALLDLISLGHVGIYVFKDYSNFTPWPRYIIWAGIFSKVPLQETEEMKKIYGHLFMNENEYPREVMKGDYRLGQ